MKSMSLGCLVVLFLSCFNSALAEGAYWNLPKDLDPQVARVEFTVGSTWHTIHGVAKQVSGKIWLEDPDDPLSVRAKVELAVNQFDTDNRSRDKELKEVMSEAQFPAVIYELQKLEQICSPEELQPQATCKIVARGRIKIKDQERDLVLTGIVRRLADESGTKQSYQVEAGTSLSWEDFGVEDPSILVARLDKVVKINLIVKL